MAAPSTSAVAASPRDLSWVPHAARHVACAVVAGGVEGDVRSVTDLFAGGTREVIDLRTLSGAPLRERLGVLRRVGRVGPSAGAEALPPPLVDDEVDEDALAAERVVAASMPRPVVLLSLPLRDCEVAMREVTAGWGRWHFCSVLLCAPRYPKATPTAATSADVAAAFVFSSGTSSGARRRLHAHFAVCSGGDSHAHSIAAFEGDAPAGPNRTEAEFASAIGGSGGCALFLRGEAAAADVEDAPARLRRRVSCATSGRVNENDVDD